MVQTILNKNCVACHQKPTPNNGNIALTNYQEITEGLVVPGSAYQSLLYQVMESGEMPTDRSMSKADIERIEVWINTGAREDFDDPFNENF